MFNTDSWKQKVGLMALGSIFTIIGMLFSPVTAQRGNFGDIECTSLALIDADGKTRMILRSDPEHGAHVTARGKDGRSWVELGFNEDGAFFTVDGKRGKMVKLDIDEHGGRVIAYGKDKGKVIIGINKYGNGAVSTWDKNGNRQ